MQKVINIGNGRKTIDINETVKISKPTSVLVSREPIATGRVRNRQYITGSKSIQGQVEVVKPDPRAELDQDKDQRRSSNHTSGAAARSKPGMRKTGPSHTMSIVRKPAGNKLSWQQACKRQCPVA